MALYRAVERLYLGQGKFLLPGRVTKLEWLDQDGIDRLFAAGAIARVGAPPLSAVPGWRARAGKLAAGGIITLEGVVEADTATLAALGGVSERVAETWKERALALLTPDGGTTQTED